jgi:hypothetical protein
MAHLIYHRAERLISRGGFSRYDAVGTAAHFRQNTAPPTADELVVAKYQSTHDAGGRSSEGFAVRELNAGLRAG